MWAQIKYKHFGVYGPICNLGPGNGGDLLQGSQQVAEKLNPNQGKLGVLSAEAALCTFLPLRQFLEIQELLVIF